VIQSPLLTVKPLEALAMRLPRVRFTVRRMMVVVAAVAILLSGELMRRRRAPCLGRLAWLAGREKAWGADDPSWEREVASPYLKGGKQMGVAEALVEIARQKRKYEYAASHPWLPIPPEPE
jgi:hypothetical protein